MRTIEEFASALVQNYVSALDAANARIITGDLAAGEFEVAAISVIEDAQVTRTEIDELERLAADFDSVDKEIAERVIAKRRDQLAV